MNLLQCRIPIGAPLFFPSFRAPNSYPTDFDIRFYVRDNATEDSTLKQKDKKHPPKEETERMAIIGGGFPNGLWWDKRTLITLCSAPRL